MSLYWIDQLNLARVPVGGGTTHYVRLSIASDPFLASFVAVDDSAVYWTEAAGDVIRKAVPK